MTYISDSTIEQKSFEIGVIIMIIIFFVITLILESPLISAGVRRLHDVGKSGCYLLLGLIPFGFICLFVLWSDDS